jgi:hypothetical protein
VEPGDVPKFSRLHLVRPTWQKIISVDASLLRMAAIEIALMFTG